MLEMAAKAAGHSLHWSTDGTVCWLAEDWGGQPNNDDSWNPRTNGNDSLRLAVKLGIQLRFPSFESSTGEHNMVSAGTFYAGDFEEYFDDHDGDGDSATRLAILRAAAEIGRTM